MLLHAFTHAQHHARGERRLVDDINTKHNIKRRYRYIQYTVTPIQFEITPQTQHRVVTPCSTVTEGIRTISTDIRTNAP